MCWGCVGWAFLGFSFSSARVRVKFLVMVKCYLISCYLTSEAYNDLVL